MLPPLKLLISFIMLVAALSTTKVRSEVGFQTGLCRRGEGDSGEDSCTELEEGESCWTRERPDEDHSGSTTACDEVKFCHGIFGPLCIRNSR